MSKEDHLRKVLDGGIVAIVRSPDSAQLVEVVRALADGGVTTVEITMTVPDALDVLRVESLDDVLVGSADGSAPMFSAVITEASLLYRWGMREDRREQVEHLVELSKHRNVQLHVQRFEDGPPIGIVSMVNIFGFRDDEPSLVFVETDYSVEEVSKPESVRGYVESFERACDAALEPADTTGYLERLAKRME